MAGKVFLVAAVGALRLNALAQSPDTSAAREIARIDREYSDLSVAKGMPAASVEYFAEGGVAFAPTAVNGKNIGPVAPIFPEPWSGNLSSPSPAPRANWDTPLEYGS